MEPDVVNTTPYSAAILTLSPAGVTPAPATIIVKGAFDIAAGSIARRAKEQAPLAGEDAFTGDPEYSAVRYEADLAPFKPRADVLCVGHACAPGGTAVPALFVSFSVGPVSKTVRVVGDRAWRPLLGRLLVWRTRPAPFTRMPVSFDRAFGGADARAPDAGQCFPGNTAGRGYSRRGSGLKGLALPNLEDPRRPVRHWWQRPAPVAFGPVGRTWQPRIRHAGTYDMRWAETRAPLPPGDFDAGFNNCAPLDQQVEGYLRGDEDVRVTNMHPIHSDFPFRLPGCRVRALLDRREGGKSSFTEIPLNLDTLWVDMDALQIVLVWRGCSHLPSPASPSRLLVVEEKLSGSPQPPESFRPLCDAADADGASMEAEVEAAERELDAATAVHDEEPSA